MGAPDAHLSSVGGLVSFNAFTREHGLHRELRRHFGRLKTGRGVVYPMAAQMQLLLDAWAGLAPSKSALIQGGAKSRLKARRSTSWSSSLVGRR